MRRGRFAVSVGEKEEEAVEEMAEVPRLWPMVCAVTGDTVTTPLFIANVFASPSGTGLVAFATSVVVVAVAVAAVAVVFVVDFLTFFGFSGRRSLRNTFSGN